MSSAARLPIAAALLFALALGPQAAAQEQGAGDDRISLASKTPWVGTGGELVLRVNATADEPAETELAVAVHSRLTSRSQFSRTLEGSSLGSTIKVVSGALTGLGPDPAGALTVRLPLQDPGQPRDPNRVVLSREGVYPVRVELRELGGGEVLAGFTTHLVYAPEQADRQRLGVATVLPFHAPPTSTPDLGRAVPEPEPLRVIAEALDSHRTVPLTVDPTPETVEALAAAAPEPGADIVSDLRSGLEGRQVISSTYVATNPRSLLASGLRSELTAQRARAVRVLSETLDVRADPRTWFIDGGIDAALLDAARSAQVDRVVVAEDALVPTDRAVTLAQPFSLEARRSDGPIEAIAADSGLTEHFDAANSSGVGPVLAAHHLLADLAVIHFDSPGTTRAAVAAAPRDWEPAPEFLDAFLTGLQQSPLVEAMTIDAAFDVPVAETARGSALVRRPAPTEAPPALPGPAIRDARDQLEAFGSLVEPSNPVENALDRVLLSSQSSDLSRPQRTAYVDAVGAGIESQFALVSLPENRSVTLTARAGEIPITIQSRLDYPVRARLRVDSDKLSFPSGSRRELELTNTNTTERFSVLARTSGAFPVRVVLESPEGDLVLGRSLFTVRSTAASGVGVALSAGAIVVLAAWWARHVLQSRRARRDAAADATG